MNPTTSFSSSPPPPVILTPVDQDTVSQLPVKTVSAAKVETNVVPDLRKANVVVLLNPFSGSRYGAELLKRTEKTEVYVSEEDRTYADVAVFDWTDDDDRKQAIELMSRLQQVPNLKRYIVVGSGDGTAGWVFELLARHGIDKTKFTFSAIPFGSGCDFHRVLGWGGPGGTFASEVRSLGIEHALDVFFEAEVVPLDVWKLELQMRENGAIRRVSDITKKLEILPDEQQPSLPLRHTTMRMTNYASIGLMGKVGIGFDGKRTKDRRLNRLVYAWESFKTLMRPVTGIRTVLHSAELLHNDGTSSTTTNVSDLLFLTDHQVDTSMPALLGNPLEIVFMNIPGIWGRALDIWGDAHDGSAFLHPGHIPDTDPRTWTPQTFQDRKLELFSLEGKVDFLARQIHPNFRRNLHRICQTSRAIKLNFRQDRQEDVIVHFMTDGEFFQLVNPLYLIVSFDDQISVTVNKESKLATTGAGLSRVPDVY
eukprot:GILJ01009324.1.p1 GENE.GILJ01009324.1~~GILJ01009324.1.p1  ORF type:complete len:480 (+),score=49.23 GILJ01009324.1:80-1519(+)